MIEVLVGMGVGSLVGLTASAVKDGVIFNPLGKFPETFEKVFEENERIVSEIDWEDNAYNKFD